jgi:hypothetical protein
MTSSGTPECRPGREVKEILPECLEDDIVDLEQGGNSRAFYLEPRAQALGDYTVHVWVEPIDMTSNGQRVPAVDLAQYRQNRWRRLNQ